MGVVFDTGKCFTAVSLATAGTIQYSKDGFGLNVSVQHRQFEKLALFVDLTRSTE